MLWRMCACAVCVGHCVGVCIARVCSNNFCFFWYWKKNQNEWQKKKKNLNQFCRCTCVGKLAIGGQRVYVLLVFIRKNPSKWGEKQDHNRENNLLLREEKRRNEICFTQKKLDRERDTEKTKNDFSKKNCLTASTTNPMTLPICITLKQPQKNIQKKNNMSSFVFRQIHSFPIFGCLSFFPFCVVFFSKVFIFFLLPILVPFIHVYIILIRWTWFLRGGTFKNNKLF